MLERLREKDVEAFRREFPEYPHLDLFRALPVSVEALPPADQERYLALAVFPEDVAVPEAALATFWEAYGLGRHGAGDLTDRLVACSLLRRDGQDRVTLHNLQGDYVRRRAGDLAALHERPLAAYSRHCAFELDLEDEEESSYRKLAELAFEIWPELAPEAKGDSPEWKAAVEREMERYRRNRKAWEEKRHRGLWGPEG